MVLLKKLILANACCTTEDIKQKLVWNCCYATDVLALTTWGTAIVSGCNYNDER